MPMLCSEQKPMTTSEENMNKESLLARADRYRLAFNKSNLGMCLVDLQGNIFEANEKMSAIFGYSQGELETMTVNDLAVPEYLQVSTRFIDQAIAGSEEQKIFEKHYRHRNGHIIHAQVASSLIRDGNGEPLYFISQVQDITERKQGEDALRISEERHRFLADCARDVIWTMELDGSISYVSPSVEVVRGFTPEEAMRQSMEEILTPDSLASAQAYFSQLHAALAAGQPLENYRGDQEYYCKDGSTFWTEVIAFPLLDANGGLIQILGVTRDISERKRYEGELKQARDATEAANRALQAANAALAKHREQLEQQVLSRTLELATARTKAESANAVKTRFMANVSHEMRTPLQGILGFAEIGLRRAADLDPEGAKKYFRTILGSGQQMHQLVESLLALTDQAWREQAGVAADQLQEIDLRAFMAEITALMSLQAEKRRQQLVFDILSAASSFAGDPIRLRQVFEHLVGNALRYSPDEAPVTLVVGDASLPALAGGSPRPAISFKVIDQGCGVPESEIKAIFEPFYESTRTASGAGGTGLGLPLSRSIVHRHRGSIAVANQAGGGVVCEVILPISQQS